MEITSKMPAMSLSVMTLMLGQCPDYVFQLVEVQVEGWPGAGQGAGRELAGGWPRRRLRAGRGLAPLNEPHGMPRSRSSALFQLFSG